MFLLTNLNPRPSPKLGLGDNLLIFSKPLLKRRQLL